MKDYVAPNDLGNIEANFDEGMDYKIAYDNIYPDLGDSKIQKKKRGKANRLE